MLRKFLLLLLIPTLLSCQSKNKWKKSFKISENIERIWISPDFWANRLQDWALSDGRIICTASAENRNLQLLTYNMDSSSESFTIRTDLGFHKVAANKQGWIGLRFAIQGEFNDFRDDAIYGKGIDVGIRTDTSFFFGDHEIALEFGTELSSMMLELSGTLANGKYILTASLIPEKQSDPLVSIVVDSLNASEIRGNIALVSSFETKNVNNRFPSAWFDNIQLAGNKIKHNPEHAYGPILFVQHTLSENILKLTAQLPPTGDEDDSFGILEFLDPVSHSLIDSVSGRIDTDSRSISFRIVDWNYTEDIPYRITYDYTRYDGKKDQDSFEGIIPMDPMEKTVIKVAAFTGNNDLGFPNNDLVENIEKHDPDLLFFSGDQIYERVGGFGVQYTPVEMAILDYLRKWYQFGWVYRDLMRSRPSIAIPDDHDVFHGNIWGEMGKATPAEMTGTEAQDQGGYKMPARFVNMVQKTQTSHLPDPYDPEPVLQGINVYYTDLVYGGISFAILEDRKFKSAPTHLLPEGEVWNGWVQNPEFDPKRDSDHPDARLLGERQLTFLQDWVADWSGDVWMKVVLSQTIFANVATLPEEEVHDQNVPKLRILNENEYAPNDRLVADMDSNGWPKTGRDNALRIIRKAFAVHIAGDQHLGSTIQYGIDDFGDAGYAICVPSVSNIWPRRWYPPMQGEDHMPGMPKYTGDYEDGFGNKMTVLAVSNPVFTGREPSNLYDRATGYGIITFNRESRNITMANWPRDSDPTNKNSNPYKGWPIAINQFDNYKPEGVMYLPEIELTGIEDPLVKVIHEDTGEMVYTVRFPGNVMSPPVPGKGKYSVVIYNPEGEFKVLNNLVAGDSRKLIIEL